MKLSVIIPVHNEEKCIQRVVESLVRELESSNIDNEILLVNDNSTDESPNILKNLTGAYNTLRTVKSEMPKGFGRAIRTGLDNFKGDIVVIFMGDGSDYPKDVVSYYNKILEGYDCVFGSRFIKESKITGYPILKLILNRMGNTFIQALFLIKYNDASNAFKAYRAEVIRAIQPLVSQYFNITVEIPLKAIIRGFSYAVIPISWNGRESGVTKYNIRALARKYFFSILFVWLEKMLLKDELKKHAK